MLEAVVERLHAVLDNRNTAAIFNAAAMAAGGGDGVRFFNPALAAEDEEQNRRNAVNGTSSSPHQIDTEDEDMINLEGTDALAALKLISDEDPDDIPPIGIRPLRINTDVGGRYQQQRPGTAMSTGEKSNTSASATSEDDTSSAGHSGPSSGPQSLGNRSGPASASTSDIASQAGRSGKGKERVDDSRSEGRGSSRVSDVEVWKGDVSAVIGLQKRGLRGLMEGRRIREMVRDGGGAPGAASGSPATSAMQNEGRVGLGIA